MWMGSDGCGMLVLAILTEMGLAAALWFRSQVLGLESVHVVKRKWSLLHAVKNGWCQEKPYCVSAVWTGLLVVGFRRLPSADQLCCVLFP